MFEVPEPERVKLGAYTPRVRVVVAVKVPDVPVIVSVLEPTLAELLTVSVRMLEVEYRPLTAAGFGEKLAVTPAGRPDTARFTLPVNPYCGYT